MSVRGMSDLECTLASGLHGDSLVRAIGILRGQTARNPLAWFVLFQILNRLLTEWDEGALPVERADRLDEAFHRDVVYLSGQLDADTPDIEATLQRLVLTYRADFVAD